jgi:copper chaperone
MSCDHCVRSVRGALEQLDGVTVRGVVVGSADVTYDPDSLAPQAILDAIEDQGYEAELVESGSGRAT